MDKDTSATAASLHHPDRDSSGLLLAEPCYYYLLFVSVTFQTVDPPRKANSKIQCVVSIHDNLQST